MEETINWNSSELVEAVFIWTGWKTDFKPRCDDAAVIKHFGIQVADKLLPMIRSLKKEFYMSDARYVAADVQEMGDIAAKQFKNKYPNACDKLIEAFVWCYTYDYK